MATSKFKLSDSGRRSAFTPIGRNTAEMNVYDAFNTMGNGIDVPGASNFGVPSGIELPKIDMPQLSRATSMTGPISNTTATAYPGSGFDAPGNYDTSKTISNAGAVTGGGTTPPVATNMFAGKDVYTDGVFNAEKALAAGMSPTQISDTQKGNYYQDQMGTSLTDYASAGAAGLGAITGVASYFDNRKMQKKQMKALDTNIKIAKEEQAHRRDFRSGTKSAFA